MNSANNLLDKWMAVCSIKTQADAARILGKSGSATLSNWRSGYAKPDDESIALMCEQAGEDAAHWIALLHYEFEESPRLRKVWQQIAGIAAGLAAVYLFGRLNVHHEMLAGVLLCARNPGTLYIMSTCVVAGAVLALLHAQWRARHEIHMEV